ncbi:MAG: hypothetical protein K2G70_05905 [Turicibacter sp.]|nr:hypothetical protein [Turicibacter sp.]
MKELSAALSKVNDRIDDMLSADISNETRLALEAIRMTIEDEAQEGKNDILSQAYNIVYNRCDANDERPYGPFSACMTKATDIFNAIVPRNEIKLSTRHMYFALVALKLARESFEHKEDNLVDICGYLAGLNDYLIEERNSHA